MPRLSSKQLPCRKYIYTTTRATNNINFHVHISPFNTSSARCSCTHGSATVLLPTSLQHFAGAGPFRTFSTSRHLRASASAAPHATEPSPLSIDQFHKFSDAYIDTLVAKLEEMQEEREDVDVEYSVRLPPQFSFFLTQQADPHRFSRQVFSPSFSLQRVPTFSTNNRQISRYGFQVRYLDRSGTTGSRIRRGESRRPREDRRFLMGESGCI